MINFISIAVIYQVFKSYNKNNLFTALIILKILLNIVEISIIYCNYLMFILRKQFFNNQLNKTSS